jgi:BlaI family penicillinase repressor
MHLPIISISMKEQTKDLTRAEEQVMQILWQLEEGFVNDIVAKMPNPKPAYNTVSTIIRILANKGFVGHKAYGKSHQYFPLVSKNDYSDRTLNSLVSGYFDNSYQNLVSFFAKGDKVSVKELEAMQAMIEEELKTKKEA